jgi:hypothetical protein
MVAQLSCSPCIYIYVSVSTVTLTKMVQSRPNLAEKCNPKFIRMTSYTRYIGQPEWLVWVGFVPQKWVFYVFHM